MKSNQKAFTLLEILLAVSILGVIAFFAIGISQSVKNMGKLNETKSRMEQIAAKAKEYYRGHEDLPASPGTPANSVPVGASDLNMEQKFRLDAWGRYINYFFETKNDDLSNTILDIVGVRVDGGLAAGVIISLGPNQSQDYVTNPLIPAFPAQPAQREYITGGDDILVPINVSKQAIEITLQELKILQSKVKAYDTIFEGINNDFDLTMDEDGCLAATQLIALGCPPISGFNNDPNCSTYTLDDIQNNVFMIYGCMVGNDSALTAIINLYSLASPTYRTDPWGREYIWGHRALTQSNPRYHKFYSMGPDQFAVNIDDIIP
ncbi:Prepilin-type N-terminal cleavage/methylation domain-containing protein [Candidatus Magnetomoraceae bacterium gMMP-1]